MHSSSCTPLQNITRLPPDICDLRGRYSQHLYMEIYPKVLNVHVIIPVQSGHAMSLGIGLGDLLSVTRLLAALIDRIRHGPQEF